MTLYPLMQLNGPLPEQPTWDHVRTVLIHDPMKDIGTVTTDPARIRSNDFYMWTGPDLTKERKPGGPGRLGIWHLQDCTQVPRGFQNYRVANRMVRDPVGFERVHRLSAAGLSASTSAAYTTVIYAEMDDGTPEDQAEAINTLVQATGLVPAMVLHSGKKSLHVHWKLSEPLRVDDPRRVQLHKLIAAAMLSDSTVSSPNRKMRVPWWGKKRTQPIWHWSESAEIHLGESIDTMVAYTKSLGIDDATAACTDMLAARDAANIGTPECLLLAERTRAARGTAVGTELRIECREHVRLHRSQSGAVSAPTARHKSEGISRGGYERTIVPSEDWPMGLMPDRKHQECPWCNSVLSSSGPPLQVRDDGTATCHREMKLFVRGAAFTLLETEAVDLGCIDALGEDPDTGSAEFIALVMEDLENSKGTIPDDSEEVSPISQVDQRMAALAVLQSPFSPVTAAEIARSLEAMIDGLEGNTDTIDTLVGKALHQSFRLTPWARCNRGKSVWSDDKGAAKHTRTSCRRYTCLDCGPRLLLALQAAARVVLDLTYPDWSYLEIVDSGLKTQNYHSDLYRDSFYIDGRGSSAIQSPDRKIRERAHNWMKNNDEKVVWSVHQANGEAVYLMVWKDNNAPGKALRRRLGIAGQKPQVGNVGLRIEQLLREVSLEAYRKRASKIDNTNDQRESMTSWILGGPDDERKRINAIRDQALGFAVNRKENRGGGQLIDPHVKKKYITTTMPQSHVVGLIENRAQTPVIRVGADEDRRKGLVSTSHDFADSSPQWNAWGVIIGLDKDGEFKPVKNEATRAWTGKGNQEGEFGFDDL